MEPKSLTIITTTRVTTTTTTELRTTIATTTSMRTFGTIKTTHRFVSSLWGRKCDNWIVADIPAYYRGCGMKSDENNTILINPKYPQPYVGGSRCSYRIYSESHRICQLRIDFLSFSLAPPTGDGLCSTDYLSIEGGSTAVPRICGENTGQHVYVGVVGRLPVWINVATSSGQAFTRRWQFRVTQIRCASPNRGLMRISRFGWLKLIPFQ